MPLPEELSTWLDEATDYIKSKLETPKNPPNPNDPPPPPEKDPPAPKPAKKSGWFKTDD